MKASNKEREITAAAIETWVAAAIEIWTAVAAVKS